MNILIFIFIQTLLSVTPYSLSLNPYYELERQDIEGLPSNMIIDIGVLSDRILLTSADGLGYSIFDGINFNFYNYDSEAMVEGGNPAIDVEGTIIAVSGSTTVSFIGDYQPAGTGVSYSKDSGQTWFYMPQPIDSMPNLWSCSNHDFENVFFEDKMECEQDCLDCDGREISCTRIYDEISWGGQDNILHLSVTTEIKNVSYDIEIMGDYIYSSSWAGGLRRFNHTLENPEWEIIPLPMDNQASLVCGSIDVSSYELNPVGDCSSDFDNHKAFSVHSFNDILWVGTANGINKGVINGDCINWTHLNAYDKGFFDNWVIAFEHQLMENGSYRLWAITWEKDSVGNIGIPSYSDDDGNSWAYPDQLVQLGVKAHNISFNNNYIYLSTNQGLYVSNDGENWEAFNAPVDYLDSEKILSDVVYDSKVIDGKLWVGSKDGVAISDSPIAPIWSIYRFWERYSSFDVYPNPFIHDEYNILNGKGYVRFIYPGQNISAKVDIFDFSMDYVATLSDPIEINNQIEFIWDGFNEYGVKVSNGVYFCRLNDNGSYKWVKLAVLGGS
ncbi:MAG: hypothetical protein CMG00_06475 [Candidatus Marinimicrobia bacterium]|nr:hypothetical protein [Candidatus Neomarinimicrobiota bacterium]